MNSKIYYKNYEEKETLLSIITATWNAEKFLPRVIESLKNQTDKEFEWIISDGSSTDNTLEILKNVDGINIKIISEEDFGIYDALNKGIKASNGEFYLVIGADDELYPNAVKDYKKAIENNVDIITAFINTELGVQKPSRYSSWLKGQLSYISGHAVGSVYRKELHNKFGYYSKKFPIAADQLFILTVVKSGIKIKTINTVVGKFSSDGVSSTDQLGTYTEWLRVQLLIGENKVLQLVLFLLRLLKNFYKI